MFSLYSGKGWFPNVSNAFTPRQDSPGSYLTALFVVLVATASIGAAQTRHYKTAYEETQQRAILELGEYMDHIESDLNKVIYTNTPPMLAKLSSSMAGSNRREKQPQPAAYLRFADG